LKPKELEARMQHPPLDQIDKTVLLQIQGSMIGLAMGDVLGASVQFRPYNCLQQQVQGFNAAATWAVAKGQVNTNSMVTT
jgi:ADP-ribosylglycohydrolase